MNSKKSIVDAAQFSAAMKKAGAVLRKSPVPALEQIFVEFRENACTLTGTDLNTWVVASVPAEGDAFSFVLDNPAAVVKASSHFSGALEAEIWETQDHTRKLTLTAADKGCEFPAGNPSLYPERPIMTSLYRYTAKADSLYSRIKSVWYAARKDSETPGCAGVRFDGNYIWCIDGNRMAVSESPEFSVERRFLIRPAALEHLKAFGAGEVEISVGERYAEFSGGGLSLLCRLIESDDTWTVGHLMPAQFRESYLVDRKQFLDALKYLGEFVHSRKNSFVRFERGRLTLFDRSQDALYSARVELDGMSTIPYTFELKFMKEALEQFSGEKYVQIGVNSETIPFVLSSEDGKAKALIMPARNRTEAQNAA